jgi:hypothetical protein
MSRFRTRTKILGAVAMVVVLGLLSGCGTYRAERQGKQAGDALCDLKNGGKDDAERNADKVKREFNDLQRIVGRPANEDLSDIDQQITDLIEHLRQGNDLLVSQDLAAIQRNVNAVARTLTGKAQAAYDGVQEGIAGCDYS